MKYLILFISLSSVASTSIHYGRGEVDKSNITTIALSYGKKIKTFKALEGIVTLSLGGRLTHLYGRDFLINDDSREYLNLVKLYSLNTTLFSEYEIHNIKLGFNIDLLGFTRSSSASINAGNNKIKAESLNALLVGENDKGTLNSEFWIGYKDFRIGMAHVVTEYEETNLVAGKRQKFFDTYFIAYELLY